MEFIASYWWLWLIGVAASVGLVAWRSVTGIYGLAKDAAELAATVRRVKNSSAENRSAEWTSVGLEIVKGKLKRRVVKASINGFLFVVGGGCGVLFALAIWQRMSR